MNKPIDEKVRKAINDSKDKFKGNELLDKYEEASKKFDELVKKGIAKKRGNNLISIMDSHLRRPLFNLPSQKDSKTLVTNF